MIDEYEPRFFDDDVDDIDDIDDTEPASARRATGAVEYHFAETDIEHGLGRLGVDRTGALAGIEFDERVMRVMHPDRVGACLLTALDRAAEKARQRRIDDHRHNRQEAGNNVPTRLHGGTRRTFGYETRPARGGRDVGNPQDNR